MTVGYNRLRKLLIDDGVTRTGICKREDIGTNALEKMAVVMDCWFDDIVGMNNPGAME